MAGQRFVLENGLLAANTSTNSIFQHTVQMNANLTVTADLLYVGGNLYVGGSQVIVGNNVYDTNIIPLATGRTLGNTSSQFDGYFRYVTIYGSLLPNANNLALGGLTNRWDFYAANANIGSNLVVTGTSSLNALNVFGATTVQNTLAITGNTAIVGTLSVSSNVNFTGSATFNANVSTTANVSASGVVLPYGAMFSNSTSQTMTANTTYVVDSFPKTLSQSTKTVTNVVGAGSVHSIESLIVHDGTSALVTFYGEIYNTLAGTFLTDVNNANVEIKFTPATSNTYVVKTFRTHTV